jgi:hypothetical protein
MTMKTNATVNGKRLARAGYTIPAVLLATTVGISLLLHGSVSRKAAAALSAASTQAAAQSSAATARFNWDVRLAASVARVNENELVLNGRDGGAVTYNFDRAAHTLSRTQHSETATVLTGVDSLSFSLYESPALYNQMQPATPANARVVGLKWTSSSTAKGISNPQGAIASLQLASR